ncbi:MAG TPA: SgcJ/EcaC family oxidoreductase [Thermoanaerobaculia bacterium]|nr:SgcJ/EcaC family oxidoreductase [Thermoanaerobaculia bacterium]
MKGIPAFFGVLFLVSGVFAASAVVPPPPSGDARLDRAIAAANSEWGPAMQAGEIDPIVRAYLADGVFVTVDGSSIRGKAAIAAFYRERFRRNGRALGTKIAPRRVVLDGDLAYEWGSGEVTVSKDGKLSTSGGPYLTVWRRQPDGDWKILRNVILP